jgi:hypothetical protein
LAHISQPDAPSNHPRQRNSSGPLTQAMWQKLKRTGRRSNYRLRKQIVKPV